MQGGGGEILLKVIKPTRNILPLCTHWKISKNHNNFRLAKCEKKERGKGRGREANGWIEEGKLKRGKETIEKIYFTTNPRFTIESLES